jgi:hypothetical protein
VWRDIEKNEELAKIVCATTNLQTFTRINASRVVLCVCIHMLMFVEEEGDMSSYRACTDAKMNVCTVNDPVDCSSIVRTAT